MISHDNLTYVCDIAIKRYEWQVGGKEVGCSYLPLSHIAPHMVDVFSAVRCAGTIFIMDKDALRGTLVILSFYNKRCDFINSYYILIINKLFDSDFTRLTIFNLQNQQDF